MRSFVLFFLLALSCSTSALTVVDFAGREVTLLAPAKRVIALAPHIVENVFSAGAGDALVGVVDYSDFPEAAKKILRVGSLSSQSVEFMVSLKPDLVIVWTGSGGEKLMLQLESLGIKVYLSDPHRLPDVAKSIRDFGVLMGTSKVAEPSADSYLAVLKQLQNKYQVSQSRLSVLYQVWHTPLQTLNREHIISDVISLCGGINAFGDAEVIAPKISLESVFARDPDVIVASGMGESRPDWLDNWHTWPNLKAVKAKNLYFIPPDLIQRHSARILEGAKIMCDSLAAARNKKAH